MGFWPRAAAAMPHRLRSHGLTVAPFWDPSHEENQKERFFPPVSSYYLPGRVWKCQRLL